MGILSGAGWVVWQAYCASCCKSVVQDAERLAKTGGFREALYGIDDADARCDCLALSNEDEPLILVQARELYVKYSQSHGESAAFDLVKNANGRVLQSLAE